MGVSILAVSPRNVVRVSFPSRLGLRAGLFISVMSLVEQKVISSSLKFEQQVCAR